MTDEQPSPRQQYRNLRLILLMGLLSLSAVTGVLSAIGQVPLLPDDEWVGLAFAAVSVVVAAVAWFWARPRIPRRRPIASVEEYWRDRGNLEAINLALFLLEGSATLGIVGTMLSGVGPVTIAAGLAMLGMLALSPEWVDRRS
jgi:hypothetical protein